MILFSFLSELLSQDNYGNTKLWWAVWSNQTEKVQQILEDAKEVEVLSKVVNKAKWLDYVWQPWYYCTFYRHYGWTPLTVASEKGRHKIVELLLNNGAAIDKSDKHGYTALMQASLNGHLDVVMLLVQHKADVHLKYSDGRTALDFARQRGHTKIEEILKKA